MSTEIAEKLSRQTSELVSRFEKRVEAFSRREDLMGLTVKLDPPDAASFAKEYFGDGEHLATGIDGSMDFDERLQMMLFYSNATAYSCSFQVGNEVLFNLRGVKRDAKLSVSSAIPLWSEDFSDVLPDLPEVDIELEHSMERIPNAFMTLAELYLASGALEKSRIIFLDRPISGTYSTLSRDYRLMLMRNVSSLTRLVVNGQSVSLLDLYLGFSLGSPDMRLPRRPRFLKHSILRQLMKADLTFSQLAAVLSLSQKDVERAVAGIRKVDKRFEGALLADSSKNSIRLRTEVRDYWERLVALALNYPRLVFELGNHPLSLPNEEWLTVLDINAVSFLLLQHVCAVSRKKRALLIGIAKDTTATDITRAALPFAIETGKIRPKAPPPKLKNDRAFLTIFSSSNLDVKTPWRTFGYDSCFSTILFRGGDGTKFMAARKVVSREGLFVRGFFQSRTLRTDPHLRSPVFLFDRVQDERYDSTDTTLEVEERDGVAEIRPYFEPKGGSQVSNLALYIISMTDNPEVFEAFGHNQLLYLADKAVKAEVRLMRSSLRGVADLRVGSMSRRRQISGIASTYREQRFESEDARMRAASSYGD